MAAVGIVLAGGRSTRMGSSKAWLEWHGSTLLRRTAGILRRGVPGPVLVVRAPDQTLPDLPSDVLLVDDAVEGRGPLGGLAAGLTAAVVHGTEAFVCATDLPFLHPAFVAHVLGHLADEDLDIVLPVAHGRPQPLAAGYRTALAAPITELVDHGERRLGALPEHFSTGRLDEDRLRRDPLLAHLDPELASLQNVNHADELALARSRPAPEVTVELGPRGDRPANRTHRMRAATTGVLLVELGAPNGSVWVNGTPAVDERHTPLVEGDHVRIE